MTSPDNIRRFLFEQADIRGEITTLVQSYHDATAHQRLPAPVKRLLGEFLAAASLLSTTLKFDGILTLQARGPGPLPLIMAECSHNKDLRGIAHPEEGLDPQVFTGTLQDLIGKGGVLTITIDPKQGARYQGVVPLDAPDLAGCLEHYFQQSEQLDTRFWLAADGTVSSGLLLQALPKQLNANLEQNQEIWETVTHLAQTVKTEELLQLDHETLLYRLFNEHDVRLFEPTDVRFHCSCSMERCATTLKSLGEQEVNTILSEQNIITIDCQFCNQQYQFDADAVAGLFHPTLH